MKLFTKPKFLEAGVGPCYIIICSWPWPPENSLSVVLWCRSPLERAFEVALMRRAPGLGFTNALVRSVALRPIVFFEEEETTIDSPRSIDE